MIRTLLVVACLATLSGCNSARKTTVASTPIGKAAAPAVATEKPADEPKQYPYQDMSSGRAAFRR